jgi:hypothetical protein
MSIHKNIKLTHHVFTDAVEESSYPKLVYELTEPNYPITIEGRYGTVSMTVEQAKELSVRLRTFVGALDEIDEAHSEVQDTMIAYEDVEFEPKVVRSNRASEDEFIGGFSSEGKGRSWYHGNF